LSKVKPEQEIGDTVENIGEKPVFVATENVISTRSRSLASSKPDIKLKV